MVFRRFVKPLTKSITYRTVAGVVPPIEPTLPTGSFGGFNDGTLNGPGQFSTSDFNFCPAVSNNSDNLCNLLIYDGVTRLTWGDTGGTRPDPGNKGIWSYFTQNDWSPSNLTPGIYLNDVGDEGFVDFAEDWDDGLRRFKLSAFANGDDLGGFVDWYFKKVAFQYAVELYRSGSPNTWGVLEIYQNGSIYVREYNKDANTLSATALLVVRWDGKIGPGGSATPEVTSDIPRPITDPETSFTAPSYGDWSEVIKVTGNLTAMTPEILASNTPTSGFVFPTIEYHSPNMGYGTAYVYDSQGPEWSVSGPGNEEGVYFQTNGSGESFFGNAFLDLEKTSCVYSVEDSANVQANIPVMFDKKAWMYFIKNTLNNGATPGYFVIAKDGSVFGSTSFPAGLLDQTKLIMTGDGRSGALGADVPDIAA